MKIDLKKLVYHFEAELTHDEMTNLASAIAKLNCYNHVLNGGERGILSVLQNFMLGRGFKSQ